MSRFGRDHVEVDHYVENVLPNLGVRFIALMDNIDSEGSADILPFRSLLNNFHLKDLSRKIKAVLHAKAKAGAYVGAFAPYGYAKASEDKGKLVIDPYAAEVVRRIYDLRLNKTSYGKITAALNKDGILAPRVYLYRKLGKPDPKVIHVWREATVKIILKNEVYLGHSVKMRSGTFSYKNKRRVDKPESEHIRVEDTHEPLISQEDWDAVQAVNLMTYDPAKRKTPELSPFAGLLICADCGQFMSCNTGTKHYPGGIKKYRSYFCTLHRQTGRTACSWHTISETTLLRLIREDVALNLE